MGVDQGAGPPKRDSRYYADPIDYTIETLERENERLRAELALADAEAKRLGELVEEANRERMLLVEYNRQVKADREKAVRERDEARRKLDT